MSESTDRTDTTDTSHRALDGRYYTDPVIFEQELDRVFARTWQLVGHISQLAEPGDVITAVIGRDPIIVANSGDGGNGQAPSIEGFYNVCQHRGHRLVIEDAIKTTYISCPYHAWVYDLSGRLARARRLEPERVGEICIPRIRVEQLAGFIFVNLDLDAPSLADTAPQIEDSLLALAPDAAVRKLTARLTHDFEANWKVAVENYNECYHCPNVHESFVSGIVDPTTFMITPKGQTIWQTASAAKDRHYELDDDSADYGAFYLWPVSSIQCYPGRILNTFRWVPLAVNRTRLIREWWFDGSTPSPEQQKAINLDWTTTVAEDFDLMESVQFSMSSRGYRPGPLIVDTSGTADVHHENAVLHLKKLAVAALSDG